MLNIVYDIVVLLKSTNRYFIHAIEHGSSYGRDSFTNKYPLKMVFF
jgi:hypothetical protein